jgi:death on curing protein
MHAMQIAEFGGLDGVRDMGAIESAIARPQHLAAYGRPDVADLAAAYAFGLAKNHGFVDGNKRIAWGVANIFMEKNSFEIAPKQTDIVLMMEGVADGGVSDAQLAAWLRGLLA